MKITVNIFLIPGLCLWKAGGKVVQCAPVGVPVPEGVDEIALCPADFEALTEPATASLSGVNGFGHYDSG